MTRHTIHVTDEDIDQGEPQSATACPMSNAVYRKYGPCFVDDDGAVILLDKAHKLHDKKGGDMSEWATELQVREVPQLTI